MTFTRPVTTTRFIDYELGDSYRHRLSIAIRPIDEFTSVGPEIPIRLKLKEIPRLAALRNLSGHLCFEEIAAGNYKLMVEPDPIADRFYVRPLQGPWIDTFEIPLVVAPNLLLSFDLNLSPRPSYPFPPNATLVRGFVTQGTPAGVGNAVVRATYKEVNPRDTTLTVQKTVEALTNREGEYVLFFKRLPKVPPVEIALKALVIALKDGKQSAQRTVLITEGQTLQTSPLDLPL
jgi:hypothetical protein